MPSSYKGAGVLPLPYIYAPKIIDTFKSADVDEQVKCVNYATSYASPDLPAGLVIDPDTGRITGRLEVKVGSKVVTIETQNIAGRSFAHIALISPDPIHEYVVGGTVGVMTIGGTLQFVAGIDGTLWEEIYSSAPVCSSSMAANGDVVVCAGASSHSIMYSLNGGGTWTVITYGGAEFLVAYKVGFGGGKFIIPIHYNGSAWAALWSTDGVNWNRGTGFQFEYVDMLAYGNGMWVTYGTYNRLFQTSPDGEVWTTQTNPFVYGEDPNEIVFDNGVFLGSHGNCVWRSTDGISWTKVNALPPWTSAPRLAYGAGRWLAVESAYGYPTVYTSTDDGATWSAYGSLSVISYGRQLVYAKGMWLAPASSGCNRSVDGITWTWETTELTTGYPDWFCVVPTVDTLLIAGISGAVSKVARAISAP
jgi:hypothetical protein